MISAEEAKQMSNKALDTTTKKQQRILRKAERIIICEANCGKTYTRVCFNDKEVAWMVNYLTKIGYTVRPTFCASNSNDYTISWENPSTQPLTPPTGGIPIRSNVQ